MLAVSRAFGDHGLKQYVTANPYTSEYEIEEGHLRDGIEEEKCYEQGTAPVVRDRFIIIACDGVWDVMTDDEAVEIVASHLRERAVGELVDRKLAEISTVQGCGQPAEREHQGNRRVPAKVSQAVLRGAAAALTDASILRGSSDNVTALVVLL